MLFDFVYNDVYACFRMSCLCAMLLHVACTRVRDVCMLCVRCMRVNVCVCVRMIVACGCTLCLCCVIVWLLYAFVSCVYRCVRVCMCV